VAFGWFSLRPAPVQAARAQVHALKNWINPPPQCVTGEVPVQTGMVVVGKATGD
jgi:hypothetical protein